MRRTYGVPEDFKHSVGLLRSERLEHGAVLASFVRHPFDRLVSAFVHKILHIKSDFFVAQKGTEK